MTRPAAHPLLRNPLKWLNKVTKRHSENLYTEKFYDTKSIIANPFAQQLKGTRRDVSTRNFPIGNMVQLVVKKHTEKDLYVISPVLEKPKKGQNPAAFTINSEMYLNLLKEKQKKLIPMKYMQRSSLILGKVKMLPNFVEYFDDLYRLEIAKSLSERTQATDGPGLLLRPAKEAAGGNLITWDNSVPVIKTDSVEEDTFIPYIGNEKLCLTAIKRAQFKQSISI